MIGEYLFGPVVGAATMLGAGISTYESIDSLAPHAQKAQRLGQRAIEQTVAGDYKAAAAWAGLAVVCAIGSLNFSKP